MWCKRCQQDVPGVASSEDDGKICCARCGQGLSSGAAVVRHRPEPQSDVDEAASDTDPVQTAAPESEFAREELRGQPPPVDLDDWEFEEDLQAVQRLMHSLRTAGLMESPGSQGTRFHAHEAHATVPHWHLGPTASSGESVASKPASNVKRKRKGGFMSFVAWTFLSFGLMTFVCGAVLVGWSFVESRPELWRIGLPLTLGGQAILLIGLLFQLEGLWQNSQDTTSTLDELDEQLHDLRHTTTLLSSSRSTAAQSFYAHMAQRASPEMLLADLKGQLDMLAVRMANDRR